ncbi:MAG: ATP-binding cassette domain-containing protein [Sphingobacteriales bacterium]|jgi:ABC-2 type transport system ATP-binding protein|nr:MAG: ATP-binding cassette domain-containing protein [Sphingobacteriales bacterium]
MSIIVENLTKQFDTQKAVNNISFSVNKGEILGFLGPNGAGKSTTMRMITGFLPPDAGKISICNLDIVTQSIEAKKKIGYLPENNPLYPDMYVKEFLDFAAEIQGIEHKQRNNRIKEIIDIVGLNIEQHKKIAQLSKGYKQRVGLAQALLHNPEILILDEPTSGLDPNQLADIRMLIKNLGKEKTIVFSTHIMQEVSAVCDSVIIISQGEIVKKSTIENLHDDNNNIRIKVSFENGIDTNKLKSYNIEIVEASADTKTIEIITKDPLQTKKTIFDFAVNEQNSILDMHEIKEDLENIFRQATQKKI